jgi:hypothetical protein
MRRARVLSVDEGLEAALARLEAILRRAGAAIVPLLHPRMLILCWSRPPNELLNQVEATVVRRAGYPSWTADAQWLGGGSDGVGDGVVTGRCSKAGRQDPSTVTRTDSPRVR